ncbi:hypothetical protein Bpfe_016366 [Biomphalaria pfeifferi]|uniref:Uncharacterized protein n=1 Tax=Biomphalaria pfeifferi TaxID=112525 RepID=A0AAD8BHX6_BIOPF|nr:hypothetical protein Bpfe_016366 [Biomphalaria pfeifferi]
MRGHFTGNDVIESQEVCKENSQTEPFREANKETSYPHIVNPTLDQGVSFKPITPSNGAVPLDVTHRSLSGRYG